MKGRKPKPAALKLAEGDTRKVGVHKLEEQLAREPKTTDGLPACPKHLKGRARAAWNFWAEELVHMNLNRRPDAMMLEGACRGYAQAVEADLVLERVGLIVEESILSDEGEKIVVKVKYHPAFTVSNRAWGQVHKFCSDFGLSPASRTRLTVEKKDTGAEDLANLLLMPRKAGG